MEFEYLREAEAEQEVEIYGNHVVLKGKLAIPDGAKAIVVFAHGSGSSRFSPRNNYVASVLQKNHFATLLIDLLSEEEADDRLRVFDVELLAERLIRIKSWLRGQMATRGLRVGYFGASTGAAAALIAAAREPANVFAVVSRGGRPDLAMSYLIRVQAPTLLIVGGKDEEVIQLNREAYVELPSSKKLEIVPEATHLFEEPGALERVALFASDWFTFYAAEAVRRSA